MDQEVGGSNPPSCTSKIKSLCQIRSLITIATSCVDNILDNNGRFRSIPAFTDSTSPRHAVYN